MGDRLVISAPPTFEPERRYILDVVLSDRLGIEWEMRTEARSDVRVTMAPDSQAREITMPDVLFQTAPVDWLQPASLPRAPLPVALPPADGWPATPRDPISVLYGRIDDGDPLGARHDGIVRLDLDIFGSIFFLLTRYEELTIRDRDLHGRMLDAASLAVRSGTYAIPLADLYVEILWDAISSLWPGITRKTSRYRAILTHDVDLPFACREGPRSTLHSAAADLLKRRDPALAARRTKLLFRTCDDDHEGDPWNVFGFLMDVAEANGLAGTFNFLADSRGPGTSRYTLQDPWISRLLSRVHARGHEIGLHGAYDSHLDPARLGEEFARLREAVSAVSIRQDRWGGRQHFLRWENPTTWRAWDDAGLNYDSTVSFAEHVGFRAGTCHAYRAYDLVLRRPLRLEERPLIAMDTTWLLYMDISLERAAELVIDAARMCRRYNGEFIGLWHNSSLASIQQQRWYRDLVPQLV